MIQPYFDQVPTPLQEAILNAKRSKSKHNRKGDSWLTQLLKERSEHLFSSEVYGAKEVKAQLEAIFSHKCAYCESLASHVTHYDVDHFRAKSHYYWLAYEWSNLILSCPRCNRDKKKAWFPLENEATRLKTHPIDNFGNFLKMECHILSKTIKSESYLLIHPALDNPKVHLKFYANGTVSGLTPKGNCSIELYDLNRSELVRMRKKKVTQIRLDLIDNYQTELPSQAEMKKEIGKIIFRHLLRPLDTPQKSQFIGFLTAILENFETFILDNEDDDLVMPDKETLRNAVRHYLQP